AVDGVGLRLAKTATVVADPDPLLPSSDRSSDLGRDLVCGFAVGGCKYIVMDAAAKLWPHRPFSDGGAEDQPDALLDLPLARNEGDSTGGVGPERECPAGADEFFAHGFLITLPSLLFGRHSR